MSLLPRALVLERRACAAITINKIKQNKQQQKLAYKKKTRQTDGKKKNTKNEKKAKLKKNKKQKQKIIK